MNATQSEAWRLTARQREVLRLVAQARSDKEIAAALGLSENTVGQHLDRIFKKLGIHSRIAAVLHLSAQNQATMSPVRGERSFLRRQLGVCQGTGNERSIEDSWRAD